MATSEINATTLNDSSFKTESHYNWRVRNNIPAMIEVNGLTYINTIQHHYTLEEARTIAFPSDQALQEENLVHTYKRFDKGCVLYLSLIHI